MKPRSLLALCVGFSLIGQFAFAADKAPARIGILTMAEQHCANVPFREGLRELGYVEGKNVVIECHPSHNLYAGLPAAAAKLVRSQPDIIVALTHVAVETAQQATREIPIVMIASGDPVAAGFVASLARPGGNITGVTYFANELYAKRLEFLKAVVPDLRRVGLLLQPTSSKNQTKGYLDANRQAARELGIELVVMEASNTAGIERAFEAMARQKIQAVHILGYWLFADEAQRIADLAMFHHIPTMHFLDSFPTLGGLMSYGPNYPAMQRRTATHVDRILRGARPAELPVEQPSRLELVINLATARELGLKVPQSLLLRADKVIE